MSRMSPKAMFDLYTSSCTTLQQLGDGSDLSRERIRQILKKYDPNYGSIKQTWLDNSVRTLAYNDLTANEIAESLGIYNDTVRKIAKQLNVKLKRGGDIRDNFPQRKSDMRDEDILDMHLAGKTRQEIAKYYGVTHRTITLRLLKMGIEFKPWSNSEVE